MAKRIIFLDVDGVLNIMSKSYNTLEIRKDRPNIYIEPHLVRRLEWLMDKTGADIVVSSSWRYDMDELKKQMEASGFTKWDRVIGKTTYNLDHRGEQILDWLNNNSDKWDRYVVIEDEIRDICEEGCEYIPKSNVVEVDSKNGLLHQDVVKAMSILIRPLDEDY